MPELGRARSGPHARHYLALPYPRAQGAATEGHYAVCCDVRRAHHFGLLYHSALTMTQRSPNLPMWK